MAARDDLSIRFEALVDRSRPEVPLDAAALLLAAHVRPDLDVDGVLGELDALAECCPEATFDGVADHLFVACGFRGNAARYGDPENSLLDAVVRRRLGIPITLSVVMMEVGRRLGVAIDGVGMPGHFIVGDGARPGRYADPFHGGARLDVAGCRARFGALHGDASAFRPDMLTPVAPRAILARMLANLERTALGHDPDHAAWMLRLHRSIPDLAPTDRVHVATRLAALGRGAEAAEELDRAAAGLPDAAAARARSEAEVLRARRN